MITKVKEKYVEKVTYFNVFVNFVKLIRCMIGQYFIYYALTVKRKLFQDNKKNRLLVNSVNKF